MRCTFAASWLSCHRLAPLLGAPRQARLISSSQRGDWLRSVSPGGPGTALKLVSSGMERRMVSVSAVS